MNLPPKLRTLIALGAIFAAMGCATKRPVQVAEAVETPGVKILLSEMLDRADKRKELSLQVKQSTDLSGDRMNVLWEGEAAEILSRIAIAKNYKFKITGPKPRLQLPVFVNLKNVSIEEALLAISEQFGERADILLEDHQIELRMKSY